MKKLIIGIVAIIVTALVFTTGAYAARLIEFPWTNNIYNVSDTDGYEPSVSVFDNGDDKCYVVRSRSFNNGADGVGISCVKR